MTNSVSFYLLIFPFSFFTYLLLIFSIFDVLFLLTVYGSPVKRCLLTFAPNENTSIKNRSSKPDLLKLIPFLLWFIFFIIPVRSARFMGMQGPRGENGIQVFIVLLLEKHFQEIVRKICCRLERRHCVSWCKALM